MYQLGDQEIGNWLSDQIGGKILNLVYSFGKLEEGDTNPDKLVVMYQNPTVVAVCARRNIQINYNTFGSTAIGSGEDKELSVGRRADLTVPDHWRTAATYPVRDNFGHVLGMKKYN